MQISWGEELTKRNIFSISTETNVKFYDGADVD